MVAIALQKTTSQARLLRLGVIGVTDEWETRYRPAVSRLGERVRLTGVYDATPSRAHSVAELHSAESVTGARQVFQTPGLNGLLLLDCGWQKDWVLREALVSGHPVFVGGAVLRERPDWLSLASIAEADALVVPECLLRYLPSALRLRELLATRLGSPREVTFDLPRARELVDANLALRDAALWFLATFPLSVQSISVAAAETADGSVAVVLSGVSSSSEQVRLRVVCSEPHRPEGAIRTTDETAPFCVVSCSAGEVQLLGPRNLQWKAQVDDITEVLEGDRSAASVALDLFARRAVGGLIPVPSLADLARAQDLANRIDAVWAR